MSWGIVAFLRDIGFCVGRESVGRWFLKAGEMLSRDGVGRRGFIAVDETVVSNLGGRAYLWAAREMRLYLYRCLGVGVWVNA